MRPRDVLSKAARPLPLVIESHRCSHPSLAHLCQASIETNEGLPIVDAWLRLQCRVEMLSGKMILAEFNWRSLSVTIAGVIPVVFLT